MAITLGDLRTFCAEIASPDSSGATADREFMVWINSATMRVFADNDWDKILHTRVINLLPQETGTALVVTQDSTAVTETNSALLEKYVTDEWDLIVDGESSQVFELGTFTSTSAGAFRDGDEWIEASGTKSWTAVKTKYDLPDNAKNVLRVQLLQNGGFPVKYLPHNEYDMHKAHNPTQTGGDPRVYTLRNNKIEIYPHPGATRKKLGISYRKGPTVLADAALDAVEIDWDEEWKDLLYKAIQLEAAITQGKGAPVPYPLAKTAYEDRLKQYRGLDGNRPEFTGPMGLNHPRRMSFPTDISFSDATAISDVGPS